MDPQGLILRWRERAKVPQELQQVYLRSLQQRWLPNRYLLPELEPAQERPLGWRQGPAPEWEQALGKRTYLRPYR